MSFEEGLRSFLLADPAVAALIDTRLRPVVLRKNDELSAATYQLVSGNRVRSLSGPSGRAEPRFQIDGWGRRPSDARTLADAIIARLDGYSGLMGTVQVDSVVFEDWRDLFEELPGADPEARYGRSLDFFFSYQES